MLEARCSGRACHPLPLGRPCRPDLAAAETYLPSHPLPPPPMWSHTDAEEDDRQEMRGGRQAGRGPDGSVGGGSAEAGTTRGIRG